jgi:hypothetical protein
VELECKCHFSITEQKDLMPNVEAHWMHGTHPQTMAFYNNGDGASQEIVDWWWCITKVVHLQVEKTQENKCFDEWMQMLHETPMMVV